MGLPLPLPLPLALTDRAEALPAARAMDLAGRPPARRTGRGLDGWDAVPPAVERIVPRSTAVVVDQLVIRNGL
ncbi:hypothetical protein [Streptomyces humi]|uniref:hypothetical protein n=1 Tax=Streptomyces humi TaxID=1428620 RepID=UPI0006286FC2|nr:hypothetical protein [Streptomyces humi]